MEDPFDEATDPEAGETMEARARAEGEAHIACNFSFLCPQRWSRLGRTDDPAVRSCAVCERPVHLVWTQAMYDEQVEAGRCAAVIIEPPQRAAPHDVSDDVPDEMVMMGDVAAPEEEDEDEDVGFAADPDTLDEV